ncbi:hypothetical protein [Massilia sp. UBA6681]|uniref:hypothetical protein n=1 Tax=Massilia sp. UBA6681 TaxID=1946839 RepID=UPI0025BBF009|nr:hypothetical protein [Massilia sp. UBA6681]
MAIRNGMPVPAIAGALAGGPAMADVRRQATTGKLPGGRFDLDLGDAVTPSLLIPGLPSSLAHSLGDNAAANATLGRGGHVETHTSERVYDAGQRGARTRVLGHAAHRRTPAGPLPAKDATTSALTRR